MGLRLQHAEMTNKEVLKGAEMEKKKVILLVEDNPDDVDLTLRAFEKNKNLKILNELVVVRDGQEALDCLFGAGKYAGTATIVPSVILLDLKLPKVDGLEVLRRIRENDRTRLYPVVILTSSRQEQDLMKGYSLGANSIIRKPVDFEKFLDAVHQLGLYWLLLNESPPAK
jgi:two-component system response regulator